MESCRRHDLSNGAWSRPEGQGDPEEAAGNVVVEVEPARLMTDSGHIKVHPPVTGAKGGKQETGRTKGSPAQSRILLWMRMAAPSGPGSPQERRQTKAVIPVTFWIMPGSMTGLR